MLMTEDKIREIISEEVKRKKYQKMMEQATPPGGSSPFPLEIGSSGPEVERLQLRLDQLGLDVVVDGEFGPDTENALDVQTGKTTVSEEEYNELLGLSGTGEGEVATDTGAFASVPQIGNLGPAEVAMLNSALAQSENEQGQAIPTAYQKPGSEDLRDFWPAWAQFIMLNYEPRIRGEDNKVIEGVLDPREIYANWDASAEKLGYTPDRIGAIQFIQNLGAPEAGSEVGIAIAGPAEEVDILSPEVITQFINTYGQTVENMQSAMTVPVTQGKMITAAKLFGGVVKNDDERLSNTRMFAALYAIRNTSWKEMTVDTLLIGAGLGLALPIIAPLMGATGAAMGIGTGASAATGAVASTSAVAGGVGVTASAAGAGKSGLFGRSITSWIRDGFNEEVAIINAISSQDIEMAEDIERTAWINQASVGSQLERGLPPIIKKMIQDPNYTKTQMMTDLGALPGDLVKESAILNHIIDQIILEVTMGVAEEGDSSNAGIPPYGSGAFDPDAVEDDDEDGDDISDDDERARRRAAYRRRRGRSGRIYRPDGTGEAALGEPGTADEFAAAGAPAVYSRQQGRTDRAQARQGGRTQRASQRQVSRAERREQGAERRADRRQGRREFVQGVGDRRRARRAARRGGE